MCDFDGSSVIETKDYVYFWQPPSVFSQWTPSRFTSEGVIYTSAEQYMMAEKARLFEDFATRAQILASDDPKRQKALGREVRGFDGTVWEKNRLEIVTAGNFAKFGQNPEARAILLATGEKTLVEASPFDRIWGIGLRADDARVYDPRQWRGLNLLGKALMAARDHLT